MNKPMPGAYRSEAVLKQLPEPIAKMIRNGTRIARTNNPIVNCTKHTQLSEPFAQALEKIKDIGEYYAHGLRSGELIPIVPKNSPDDRYYAPGELFFTS